MNGNPEWLMPPMGKQDVSPYDILIDLVPWYATPQLGHVKADMLIFQ
jgi:hypothetical protein